MGTPGSDHPPAAPPLMPNTGPSDGCRMAAIVRQPMRFSAMLSPMVVVVFPSPRGVGVIAVTSMYLPFGRPPSRFITSSVTFALVRPYSSSSSSCNPSPAAISAIGFSFARWAISRSESKVLAPCGGLGTCGFEGGAPRLADRLDADRADFVLGDLGRGIAGGIGEEIRRRVGKLHERHEDGARPHRLGEK